MSIKRVLLFVSVFFLLAAAASAGNKPLSLVSTSPEVASDSSIELLFSNNVVNLSVQEINREAFELKDNEGNPVEIEVIFPDDQLEPEKKRLIIIQPLTDLEKNINYTLHISGSVQAKNGQTLGEALVLTISAVR